MLVPHLKAAEFQDIALKTYGGLFYSQLGALPKVNSIVRIRAMFKGLQKNYTNAQIYALLFCHFEWRGVSGTDEYSFKRLYDQGFPIEILVFNSTAYSIYVKNILGDDVWNDEAKLLQVVDSWKKELSSKIYV